MFNILTKTNPIPKLSVIDLPKNALTIYEHNSIAI